MALLDSLLPLSSAGFCIGVMVATVILVIAAVLLLPRRPARRGRVGVLDMLLQAVALVLVSVLAVSSVALWINREYALYPTWSDLLMGPGTARTVDSLGAAGGDGLAMDPAQTASLQKAERAAVPASLRDPLHDAALQGVKDTSHGQWVTALVNGSASDVNSDLLIHLPAGYLQHPDRRYPVILAFGGYPGTPQAYEKVFHLGEQIDQRAAAGTMTDAIVVSPNVYPPHYDTECVNVSQGMGSGTAHTSHRAARRAQRGTQWETWIATDVPGFLHSHLRTVEDPSAWATFGDSAGGWCASMISVRHPDLARTSISMAGYFRPDYSKGQVWTAPDDPRYDLPRIVQEKQPPVTMYVFLGGQDPLPRPTLSAMTTAVSANPAGPTTLTVVETPRGGHAAPLWVAHTPEALTWLSTKVPAFEGSSGAQR